MENNNTKVLNLFNEIKYDLTNITIKKFSNVQTIIQITTTEYITAYGNLIELTDDIFILTYQLNVSNGLVNLYQNYGTIPYITYKLDRSKSFNFTTNDFFKEFILNDYNNKLQIYSNKLQLNYIK